jgi:dipeptidyl aminopeptidase/acylaminoacyl peptidase
MKFLIFLIFILIFSNSQAQVSGLLIKKTKVSDFSGYPVYEYLTEVKDGKTVWKEKYTYIDSIDVYSITYVSDGLKINGLLVKPKANGKYPGIIYNRGGNRDFGKLVMSTGLMTMGRIANEGYVLIGSQYRGNAGGEGKEEFGGVEINDVIILEEVLKEIEEADAERIGMFGWSRGGMMTYIALTKTNNIKAAAVGGAPSDLLGLIKDRPEMETNVLAELIPNYEENKESELHNRSAIMWADKFPKNVPILMLHGNSDWRVKPQESLNMALEFEKYRVPYRLVMYEGGDHGISEHREEVNEQIIRWFDKYLKNDAPLPNMEYHGR